MTVALLALVLLVCLVMIPLGLPGLWIMVGVAVVYNGVVGADAISIVTMVGVALLALGAEIVEFMLSGRYARKYGGSRRSSWGAVLGGMAGAFMGVPVPIVGPMIGAFVGAFAGALVFEYTRAGDHRIATRAATGALLGRVVAAAMKVAMGGAIMAWIVADALI